VASINYIKPKANKLIKLSGLEPFGTGAHRDTYIHPFDSSLILKVTRNHMKQTKTGLFGLSRSAVIDPNQLEFDAWNELVASGHDKSDYFSQVLGWSDTDMGRALCVERIMSDDGSKPIILKNLLINPAKTDEIDMDTRKVIISGIDKFFDYMTRHAIHSFAYRLENIAFYNKNGNPKIKSFDSKAMLSREWIPITKYFKFARRWKVKRRTAILRNRLIAAFGLDVAK
jgi:hypothetical protein